MYNLKEKYHIYSIDSLNEKFNIKNKMETPKITKVTLSIGAGEAITNKNYLKEAVENLTLISGQKPIICKAKKSISSFKVRKGWPIGCKVTLRGNKMYEFLDRLVFIVIPRIRDFRGLNPNSFDNFGNFSMGVKEQTIFPEIPYDTTKLLLGLNISINISSNIISQCLYLLKSLNFPFKYI